ncbi:DUF3157 family protein [Psychromonas sp. MME1]|uniref:DUF3157 family protein n=1 Tax=Psychromonas sp. MME1 TaxID=3231032 RepID=UPI0034E1B1C3
MHNKYSLFLTFVISIISLPSLASEETLVTLENGKVVKLNPDFTWQYVVDINSIKKDQASTSVAIEQKQSPTIVTNPKSQWLSLNDVTQKNDVNVKLLSTQWENGRLGLIFELASQSPDNYVTIDLAVSLFSDSGELLKEDHINVWQATFRLPDSYLRKGQVRESRIFWFSGINKEQWTKQLININIEKMESRG